MTIELSGAKKFRSTLDQIGLGEFRIKGHYMVSTGMIGTIRQRLEDIEQWMSEMNLKSLF